eukprot:CAMPEP_0168318722 /NCGR_PEP_ID=MMETSP0213-20121227/642_1 /TAXON_ID=151035 /ORGANISM="Euplotes harpa, Strain FSP1.4" /LENGTH=217 /DNA_ID=CAMNT_0008319831 /DNA_START=47 /DNA_END=700 /DNA_ORIENTATION=-
MSDVAVAMSVFFKNKPAGAETPRRKDVRERLESMDSPASDSHIHKLFSKQEKAEKNRSSFLENRVRALSEQDELRLQKVEAVNEEVNLRAQRIHDSQTRAMKNRKRLLSKRSERLKRRHTLIENQICVMRKDEIEARTKLSIVFEKKGQVSEIKRNERIKNIAERARKLNQKVTETVEKAKADEKKKSDELREQWEIKIERAREKRQQLLQQKTIVS